MLVTNVYGPSRDEEKEAFIHELRTLTDHVSHPWLLVGDFNLVRWLVDRSGDMRNFGLMSEFNDLMMDSALIDVPLRNRSFTWSNKRPQPTFSKIDRVFVTHDLSVYFPSILLSALEVVVSDHAPLLLTCKQPHSCHKQFRFETCWFSSLQVRDMVRRVWQSSQQPLGAASLCISNKIDTLQHQLRLWHMQSQSHIEKELESCKQAILAMDQVEEQRQLNQSEFSQRQMWRKRAFHLATVIEIRWKQRARCRWFFHSFASSRARINTVHSLVVQDQTVTDTVRIRSLFLNHMQALLGTQSEVAHFNPSLLYESGPNLSPLQDPITEQEVANTIYSLANNRASGPDGLPNEFAKVYWSEIKFEVMRLVTDFFNETIDLRPLNTANIIMIPKKADAVELKDFRPISIISLIPKIISKLLATRLSRFLPDLISINQMAFVKGRQGPPNFRKFCCSTRNPATSGSCSASCSVLQN